MAFTGSILAINAGSSTIRFGVYSGAEPFEKLTSGKLEGTGGGSVAPLLDELDGRIGIGSVFAVGHRVVHGMRRDEPAAVTPALIEELRGNIPFDPEHLPQEIELMEAIRERYPDLPQVACFDTAFHRTMPRVARVLPIPRRYQAEGIVRYGFHGLSYAFLVDELARVARPELAGGRVVLAHLGNGASLCAVQGGKSIDTTMGFTPAAGVPMSTRTGDLDPGVAWYLMSRGMTPEAFSKLINHESGLLGVSETSSDMRELLANEGSDERAAEAIELFCYQVRKSIGALAAALEGLDGLVFAGGIGENNPSIRARICSGLQFLGVELDGHANAAGKGLISKDTGRAGVYCIPTNEELMIARLVGRFMATNKQR